MAFSNLIHLISRHHSSAVKKIKERKKKEKNPHICSRANASKATVDQTPTVATTGPIMRTRFFNVISSLLQEYTLA